MSRTPGMRRYIFNITAALSLLLMLETVGMWVHHSTVGEGLESTLWDTNPYSSTPAEGLYVSFIFNKYLYIQYTTLDPNGVATQTDGSIPLWLVVTITLVLPAIWLIALVWRKRRALSPNACPGCGYDLTGNVSGVCPECGVKSADFL